MASGGGDGGQGPTTAAQTMYFCHQCNDTVSISNPSELVCPHCNGGFLEFIDNNPNPNSINTQLLPHPSLFNPFFTTSPRHLSPPLAPFLLSSPSPSFDPLELSSLLSRPPFQESEVLNPFQFLQAYLQNNMGPGRNLQLVIENNTADRLPGPGHGSGSLRLSLPANLGDYFIGPGLEQLIQQLAENDPNRHGTPPASKTAVESLPTITITQDQVSESDDTTHHQCAVCMDDFELGSQVKQMPCKHVYHSECLLPWLQLHNSCPVCRYQLPTDDSDYENQHNHQIEIASDNNSNHNVVENDRTVERRIRISLPWSVSRPPDTQRSQTSHNSSTSVDTPTHSDFGSPTRQQHLD